MLTVREDYKEFKMYRKRQKKTSSCFCLCSFCFWGEVSNSWILNDVGRNFLLGNRKKIAKYLMRTFTCRSTFLYVDSLSVGLQHHAGLWIHDKSSQPCWDEILRTGGLQGIWKVRKRRSYVVVAYRTSFFLEALDTKLRQARAIIVTSETQTRISKADTTFVCQCNWINC